MVFGGKGPRKLEKRRVSSRIVARAVAAEVTRRKCFSRQNPPLTSAATFLEHTLLIRVGTQSYAISFSHIVSFSRTFSRNTWFSSTIGRWFGSTGSRRIKLVPLVSWLWATIIPP